MLECLVAIQMMVAIYTRLKLVCHSSSCCTAYRIYNREHLYHFTLRIPLMYYEITF